MAARTSSRLSQGGQPAVLGPGLQQSTRYLAAFAGFGSSHNIKLWPVQFVSNAASHRDLNSDPCASVHHEASMAHCTLGWPECFVYRHLDNKCPRRARERDLTNAVGKYDSLDQAAGDRNGFRGRWEAHYL